MHMILLRPRFLRLQNAGLGRLVAILPQGLTTKRFRIGAGFNMSATGMTPNGAQCSKQARQSAILLACAGGLVIVGAFAAMVLWIETVVQNADAITRGSSIYALLCVVLVAIVLSIASVARLDGNVGSASSIQGGARGFWPILAVLILIHVSFTFLLNRSVTGNTVDTFTFQRDACKGLLHGTDPFGTTQVNIHDSFHTALFYGPGMVVNGRVQVGFQYPPLTLLWALPGYLTGDVRYSYIFAIIISALFSFAICPGVRGLWIVSILLFSPLTFLVENRCWTEPLVLMTLSATVYAAVKRRWWLPVALGLFLATKQYNFLALPFIGYFVHPFQWKAYWKLTGLSLIVGLATVLPFAFWNLRGVWHDLVLFQLAQPFRQDGLSFAVPFPLMTKIGPLAVAAFIIWATRAGKRNPAMFSAAYGVALLLFVSTSKQGMANYYFLIAQAFFLAVAALPGIPLKLDQKQARR